MREEEKVNILKAIAHPVRLKILQYLTKGASCATLANKAIPISQPNMSQHLKYLKSVGLINFRKIGTKHCYYLCRPSFVFDLLSILDGDHQFVEKSDSEINSDLDKKQNEINRKT
jgi:DNA-binding transcriptional ArsR family regulator